MTTEQAIKLMRVEVACIERASNADHPCTRECEKCDLIQKNTDLLAAYSMAVAALRAQQWISVKDRLPDDEVEVLVYWHNKAHDKRYIDISRRENQHFVTLDRPWIDVTHWMPLPEPPKEAHDE